MVFYHCSWKGTETAGYLERLFPEYRTHWRVVLWRRELAVLLSSCFFHPVSTQRPRNKSCLIPEEAAISQHKRGLITHISPEGKLSLPRCCILAWYERPNFPGMGPGHLDLMWLSAVSSMVIDPRCRVVLGCEGFFPLEPTLLSIICFKGHSSSCWGAHPIAWNAFDSAVAALSSSTTVAFLPPSWANVCVPGNLVSMVIGWGASPVLGLGWMSP